MSAQVVINICAICSLDKDSEWFWEAHQIMSDRTVWCINAKRKDR
jgi:hypothetical protein